MRFLPRTLLVVPVLLLLSGCGAIQDMGGVMDLTQACAETTRISSDLLGRTAGLSGDADGLREALNETAAKLGVTAAKAGEPTVNEAISGLAASYRDTDTTDTAAATAKIRSRTAEYLQIIARACN